MKKEVVTLVLLLGALTYYYLTTMDRYCMKTVTLCQSKANAKGKLLLPVTPDNCASFHTRQFVQYIFSSGDGFWGNKNGGKKGESSIQSKDGNGPVNGESHRTEIYDSSGRQDGATTFFQQRAGNNPNGTPDQSNGQSKTNEIDYSSNEFVDDNTYYDWGDGYDTKEFCNIVRKRLTLPNAPSIVVNGYHGGLGHKFINFYYSVAVAIFTKRHLLFHIPPSVANVTSHCLSEYRYYGNFSLNGALLYGKELKMFNASACGYVVNNTISELFRDDDVIMENCRFKHQVLYNPENVAMMGELGFSENEFKADILTSRIFRILINPAPYLHNYLTQFKKDHYHNNTVFGVQVRMGGCYANYQEGSELISLEKLHSIPELIRVNLQGVENPVIYLSTDSDYAERYLREALPEYEILTSSNMFVRKHSTGRASLDGVQGALVDILLLADSDILLVNKGSGFGKVAMFITRAKKIVHLETLRRPTPHYDFKRRKCIFEKT